jgi:hypothetical protein
MESSGPLCKFDVSGWTRPPTGYPWWRILIDGVVAIVIGATAGLFSEDGITLTLKLIGFYWLVSGILTVLQIFSHDAHGRRLWLLIQGILTILVALIIFNAEPLNRALWPELVNSTVGITGILIGLVGILQAFKGGGIGAGLLGFLSLGFGDLCAGQCHHAIGLSGLAALVLWPSWAAQQASFCPSASSPPIRNSGSNSRNATHYSASCGFSPSRR